MTATGLENLQLRLNTVSNTRKTWARLVRLYAKGQVERTAYRDMGFGFEKLLKAWRLEIDTEFAERLDLIEEQLEMQR